MMPPSRVTATSAPNASLPLEDAAIRARTMGASRLPLVIEPMGREARSVSALTAWMAENHTDLRQKITEHGALLFRGFAVDGAVGFERVARAVDPHLENEYLGTSPRNALTSHVFSASELPPHYPIPQHCEMSFTRAPPSRLFFCCFVPSSGPGGETPLADFRLVYADLDPEVRARFVARGVRNIRNYAGPEGGGRFDLWKLKRWDEMFQTTHVWRRDADPGRRHGSRARCGVEEHGLHSVAQGRRGGDRQLRSLARENALSGAAHRRCGVGSSLRATRRALPGIALAAMAPGGHDPVGSDFG